MSAPGPQTQGEAEQRSRAITRPEKPFQVMRWTVTGVLALAFVGSVLGLDANWDRLPQLPGELLRMGRQMFLPPDPDWIGRALTGMWETLAIAWIGTLIGAVLSFPLAFLAASNLSGGLVVGAVRQVLNVLRAVPEIIFAILFLPLFGLNPLTGAMAIGISSIGTIGKLTAEVIEAIDPGPVEAADAVGANRVQRVRWAVIPQVMPEVVALWLYRFEINIRASAILGLVGAGGIGTLLNSLMGGGVRDLSAAGTALIVIVLATLLVDVISGRLRRRIIAGPRRPIDIGGAPDEGDQGGQDGRPGPQTGATTPAPYG